MAEQQPEIKTTPYASPLNMYGSSILQLTNPEHDLYKLELTYRGQVMDNDMNVKDIGRPLMNDEGICAVMGIIQTIVSQVTIMSNLDVKKEIPILMDLLGDTLSKDLMVNCTRYNLSPLDRDKVYSAALISSFICMKRAAETSISDKKFWRGSVQEISTRMEQPRQQGIFSKLTGWGK